ncbi:MAG: amino acid adenylation domain-containing protein [Bacteroidales bacterium]|nr:amino acid adenylation domain-containing protein [Candidatus Egerieousia equi]
MKTYPLTQTQTGIYISSITAGKNGNYNLDMLYSLDKSVDLERLAQALNKVIEIHPYVKSRLVTNDGGEVMLEEHVDEVFCTPIIEINNIEDVRAHLGEDYDLLKDSLFRLEIYKTQKGNYLYVDFHHIIFDGMSMTNFRRDLSLAYAGQELVPEGKDGFTVALEEHQLCRTEVYSEAKAWHVQEFAAAADTDSLPLPDVYGKENGEWIFAFHPLKTNEREIMALCAKHNVGVSIPFTAAFGYALSKYSSDDAALYATIFHGRSDKSTLNAYNMMVKTLAVYQDFIKTPTVTELLQQTSSQMAATRKNAIYPFSALKSDLGLSPRVCFAYQGTLHTYNIDLDGRLQEGEDLRVHRPGFDLAMHVIQNDDGYFCKVEYNTGMYSSAFIEQFCKTYSQILYEMLTKDALADIDLVDDGQLAQIDSFNEKDSIIDLDDNATVLSEFRHQVQLHPENIAIVFKDKRYTYKELDELTDRYAGIVYDKIRGCENAEPVVSIIIHRNEWMVLASLAAIKAGCAYQPLDPSYPQERLNFMVKDAGAVLLIADPDLRDLLDEYDGEVLLVGEIASYRPAASGNKLTSLSPQSLLTLLYTSGSTGVPKGVMIEHRNLIAFNKSYSRYLDITSQSRIAAYASFGFDANMQDIYCTLMSGATLHILDEDVRLDMEALHQYYENKGITHCFMTTQVGVQYLENYPHSSTLRHLVMGGEKLRAVKPEKLDYKIHNGYGPSEATCGCAFFRIDRWEPNIPVGKPLATCNFYVVDKYGHRLPVGAPGELWINGPQVSRGYLNRPDKTAENFTPNPFGNGRVYHSGDIVRYRQDGNIEFVGRRDGQVKIRGFRIELKEVEAVIREFPGVRDVTVQAFDNSDGGKFIAAYVVTEGGLELDVSALNEFIAKQKPPYMVPAVTMQIEKIPLTVNQKVDRKVLPEPRPAAVSRRESSVSVPMNRLEIELYNMVAQVLSLPQLTGDNSIGAVIGVNDNLKFFGLTSLSSIKLAYLVYKRFSIQIDSKSLSHTGTLQSIENELLGQWMSGATAIGETVKETIDEVPLTFAQQGVYSDCAINPDSTLYNIPMLIKLPSSVSAGQVEEALEAFVDAHPALRSHFAIDGDGAVMIKRLPKSALDMERHSCADEEDILSATRCLVRPFKLNEGPLFRFSFIQQAGSHYLLADFHHLICDGASCDTFLKDLCLSLEGRKPEVEEFDYYNFAAQQKLNEKDKEYMDSRIAGLEEVSMLLPDNLIEENANHKSRRVSAKLNLSVLSKMAETVPELTTAGICLAISGICISRYLAEDEVSLCIISNGRSDSRFHRTMGMFVNTLPFVSSLKPEDSVNDYLLKTCRDYEEALRHEHYPFARIAHDYGYKANIVYAYQIGVLDSYKVGNEALEVRTLELDKAKFPVYIAVKGTLEDAHLTVEYDSSLYSEEMMQGLADAYAYVAQQITHNSLVRDLSLTSEQMIAHLDTFNRGYQESFAQSDIVTLFRKAAAEHPGNTAVIYKDKSYTYKELDDLTDRMAALVYEKVRGCGKTEPVVSVLIHRSEWMVLASLAALKAGCAYQPLDPDYPQERLNFMVKDAGAALVIADSDLNTLIDGYDREVLLTDELPGSLPVNPGIEIPVSSPQSLFILLYTSGSTGVPKGVMLEHGNLSAFCDWYRKYYSLTPGDCVGSYASYGFDACMMDMYPALTNGAAVCIVPEEIRLDLTALNDYFKKNAVTLSFMTTQVGVQYLLNVKDSCLRHLSVGGEKLPSVNPASGYDFHNGYGPTECTIFSTTHMVYKKENNIPIGRPTNHLKCYVMDKFMHRLPVGASGELIICGRQVGRGYLNRPDKTKEAFFTIDGQRAYHSGDIVRYRNDGNIEFVGRKDSQVKVRGFRIELKEVEAVIREFQGVSDVTVQAFDDPSGGKFIVAYVVMKGMTLDKSALNSFIAVRKPSYMVPATTVQIDKIPLTVNQKVDRKALPTPQADKNCQLENFVAPQGHLEETIARCIAETLALDVKTISAHDSFPSLGGTSIKSISLMALLKKNDIVIPIARLLELNDIRFLALVADYASRGEYVEKRTVLMPAQLRMLKEKLLHPDRNINAFCIEMDIDASITEEHIRKAADSLVRRHPAISSAIAYVGVDMPLQVYLDRQIPISVIDAENNLEAVGLMMDQRQRLLQFVNSIQLSPLFHLSLVRIERRSSYLMLAYNGILAEDWRIRTWIAELFEALRENGGECIENWCFLLSATLEMSDSSSREEWATEDNAFCWNGEGLGRNDGYDDNYKVLTEVPGTKQLVFVHTGNTGSEAYQSLANQLEGFCSFAVLDQWNLYHRDDIKHGIPEIASKYIEVLRAHQPHGPYYLGGWCYGGMIAYEMACQLTAAGELVEQLIMFDVHTVKKQIFKEMFIGRSEDSMRKYFERSPLFESLIKRGLEDTLVANSLQVNFDMMSFHPKLYDGNVLYFKAIAPAKGLKGRMAEYFEEMNSKRAGGYEKYIPNDKLHIVDIKQEHDNLMNEASLSIEVPVMKQYL